MQLKGSCHCGAVTFEVESRHPYPYNLCYCGICRKTTGAGGYAINIRADAATLKLQGQEKLKIYHAKIKAPDTEAVRVSDVERHFCGECGSALFVFHPDFPEGIYPMVSTIDTPLPIPPSRTHMMLEFKPDWVEIYEKAGDIKVDRYPNETVDDWHKRHELV